MLVVRCRLCFTTEVLVEGADFFLIYYEDMTDAEDLSIEPLFCEIVVIYYDAVVISCWGAAPPMRLCDEDACYNSVLWPPVVVDDLASLAINCLTTFSREAYT